MKAVIEQLNDKSGYIVTCEDGREFVVKDIDEAIAKKDELKEEIKNDTDL